MKLARDFARVKAEGVSLPGKFLVLGSLRVAEVKEFQFGLITGARIGNAVVRNRVRRLLREVIRAHRSEISSGWRFVVVARWRAPQASLEELEKDWLRLAKKAGLLKPKSGLTAPPSTAPAS